MTRKTHAFPDFGALSRNLDPQWIAQALAATGCASVRKRKLPAEQVIWLIIALAMYRHQSMAQVVADLDLVLLDPPFGLDLFATAVQVALPLLAPEGWIYLEADRPFDEAACAALGLTLHRHGRAGMVHYHLLKLHP